MKPKLRAPGTLPGILCLLTAALTLASTRIAASMVQSTDFPAEDQRARIVRHLDLTYAAPVFHSLDAWKARRESLRRQILVAAGLQPMPHRGPLNPQMFDRLNRDGYSVEKVYFESYAGFYVTGNLYRPIGKPGPFPAVLAPHGHWAYGRLQNSELCSIPARCISMARQGYIVFTFDMVGYNDSHQVNHRYQSERGELWGFGSLGLHLWNSIRSLDFLESLPEVDRSRLACTGESGGGTQTFLLTAVDDRVSLSAPVNMISAHMQGGDVCENAPNLRIDTNNMEIGAMMAPRPMMMVSATGDWTKNTFDVEYPAIRSIYRLYGAEEKIQAVQVRAEHNYNLESREHVYRWFGRWLLGLSDGSSFRERGVSFEFPSALLVFYARSLPEGTKNERQIEDDFIRNAQAAVEALKPRDAVSLQAYRAAFDPALRYSLMADCPAPEAISSLSFGNFRDGDTEVRDIYFSRTEKGDRIPARFWIPEKSNKTARPVLLLLPDGTKSVIEGTLAGKIVKTLGRSGASVLVPDLFNTGRATHNQDRSKRFFTTYNRSDEANRIQDILTSLVFLQSKGGSTGVRVVALENAGPWAYFARAFFKGNADFYIDMNQFDVASDAAFLKWLNIPGIRRAGDFKTAGILNTEGALRIRNFIPLFPVEWTESIYRSIGKERLVNFQPGVPAEAEIFRWLQP